MTKPGISVFAPVKGTEAVISSCAVRVQFIIMRNQCLNNSDFQLPVFIVLNNS